MRYLRLYFTCIKRSMMSRLEYKKDSIISILAFLISNACSLCSIYFILQTIPSLKGYTPAEVGFFYGFSMLPIAIDHLFSDEFWLVAYRRVQLGDMDRHFLRPVPVIFQMFAETFQPDGFGEVIVGVTMIVICGLNLQVSVTFGAIFVLSIGAIFGAVIITSFKIAISSLAFIFSLYFQTQWTTTTNHLQLHHLRKISNRHLSLCNSFYFDFYITIWFIHFPTC